MIVNLSPFIPTVNTSHYLSGLYIYKPEYATLYYINYILPPIDKPFNLDSYTVCNCFYSNICIKIDLEEPNFLYQ